MSESVDQAFRRFQQSGAPDALAAVFDDTAAELLRVASHLTHDLHAAEDLVQETFLGAIVDRQAFATTSGVLQWLLGILVNRARRRRRDADRAPDPQRLQRASEPGPPEAALALELSEAVGEAIAALPEPYRPVLVLHLRHRLNARQIALALERPPGTVRTQLVRGLDLLRRALPAGLAVGVAVTAPLTAGLAAMRATVLARASEALPVAVAGLTGVLLMKKVSIGVVVGLALLSVLVVAWPPGGAGGGAVDRTESVAVAAAPTADSAPMADEVRAVERRVVAPPAPAAAPVSSTVGWIAGRCIDEQGHPLAGVSAAWQTLDGKDAPPAQSATDGTFRLTVDPAGVHCQVTFVPNVGVALEGLGRVDAGATLDFGNVRFERGCRVEGRIVDRRGDPPPGARVSLRWTSWQETSHPRPWPKQLASTGADPHGAFVFDERLPSGVFEVSYYLPATRSWVRAADLTVAAGQDQATLEIVCAVADELPTITGRVVDERGVPVATVDVECRPPLGGPTANARTDSDGSFCIRAPEAMAKAGLQLSAAKAGYEPLETPAEHHLGETGVTLMLRTLPVVHVTVVEQDSGAPVEEFGLRLFPEPLSYMNSSDRARLVLRGSHPRGEVLAAAQRFGRHLLIVEPARVDLAPSRIVVVEVGDHGARVRVALPRRVTRTLVVRRADGTPVAGTRLELVAPTRELPVRAESRIIVGDDYYSMSSSDVSPDAPTFAALLADYAEALSLQSGETDANGQFVLRAGARDDLALHLRGPGHPVLFVPVDMTATGPLEVEVITGGRIEGTLTPVEVARQLRPGVQLIAVGDPKQQMPEVGDFGPRGFPVRDDGTFVGEGVPPGDWRAYLVFRCTGTVRIDPIGIITGLRDGQERRLDVDVRHLEFGRLQARVMVDGAPLSNARVDLRGQLPEGQGEVLVRGRREAQGQPALSLLTDASGALETELLPGTYRCTVRFGEHSSVTSADRCR